ncbi:MAG: hypothetical protein KDB07_02170, partial [Planctomycetes bacterium]|nr:hypothetical protein [Planctomycetota bacterium]
MLHLVIGTSNNHKVVEIASMLSGVEGVEVQAFSEIMPVPDVEEDGKTFAANAETKALLIAQYLFASRGASASGRHTAISHDTISLDKLSAERARSHRQAQAAKDSGQSSRR